MRGNDVDISAAGKISLVVSSLRRAESVMQILSLDDNLTNDNRKMVERARSQLRAMAGDINDLAVGYPGADS